MPPEFTPDLSNPFQGNVQMALQQQLANLNNLWSLKGIRSAAPTTTAQVPAPVAGRMDPAQAKYLEDIMDLWRMKQANQSPEAIRQNLQSLREYEDPVAFEQQNYQARLAKDPWGPGGQFEGRRAADLYSPEAIVASQGRTAENMIRQAGGGKKPSETTFDVDELKRMNRIYAANKSYS
jgi:hypothetical protein